MGRYPVLVQFSQTDLLADLAQHYSSSPAGASFPEAFVEYRGRGGTIDLTHVRAAADAVDALRSDPKWVGGIGKAEDEFEAAAAENFHGHMSKLEALPLGDPDFWRWVAVAEMWDATLWRRKWKSGNPIQPSWFGLGGGYWRALPVGLFLRVEVTHAAASVAGGSPVAMWSGIEAIGLWQDQLYAVETGASPAVVAAFLKERKTGKLSGANKSAAIKRVGRAVNSLRSSVLSETLDQDGGEALMKTALDLGHVK